MPKFVKKIILGCLTLLLATGSALAAVDYSSSRAYFRNSTKSDLSGGQYIEVKNAYALDGDVIQGYVRIINSGDTASAGNIKLQRTDNTSFTWNGTFQKVCTGDTTWVDLDATDWANFNSGTQLDLGAMSSGGFCIVQYYLSVGTGNDFDTVSYDSIELYDGAAKISDFEMKAYIPHFKIESANETTNEIKLKFQEPLNQGIAETIGNYAISKGGSFTNLTAASTATWNSADFSVTLTQSEIDLEAGDTIYVRTNNLKTVESSGAITYGPRYLNTSDYTSAGYSISKSYQVKDSTKPKILNATFDGSDLQLDWDETMRSGSVSNSDFVFSDASTLGTSPTSNWFNNPIDTLRVTLDADGSIVTPDTTTIAPAVGNSILDIVTPTGNSADDTQTAVTIASGTLNLRPVVDTFTPACNLVNGIRYCSSTNVTIGSSNLTASDADDSVNGYLINESSSIPGGGFGALPASYTISSEYQNLYAWVTDSNSAVSNSKKATVVYDGDNPSVSASPSGGDYTSEQTVTLSCSDLIATTETIDCYQAYYSINGGALTPFTNGYKLSIDSNTSLALSTTDKAGNTDTATENYNFVCDPSSVANGTVAAYPDCTITCDSGYSLSGSTCVADTPPAPTTTDEGGRQQACSDVDTVEQLSTSESNDNREMFRLMGLSDTQGIFTSPVKHQYCYSKDYTVDYPKGLAVTLSSDGSSFTGNIKAPQKLGVSDIENEEGLFVSYGAVELKATNNEDLTFSTSFTISIPYSEDVIDTSDMNVYRYNPDSQSYELINSAKDIDQESRIISISSNQFGVYSIFESSLESISLEAEYDIEEETVELQSIEIADPFTDIAGHWAEEFIDALRLMGIIHGKTPGIFGPNLPITRAELTKIAVGLFKIPLVEEVTEKPFSDVAIDQWYAPYISSAKAAKTVSGYPDGTFKPNKAINRVEALAIILEASGLEISGGEMNFEDTIKGSWYEKYVAFAQSKGIVSGYTETVTTGSEKLFTKTLKLGDYNDEVQKLQQVLTEINYYDGRDTGYFGAYTEEWIQKLQSDYPAETGADPAGVVGEATAAKIAALAGLGTKTETKQLFKPQRNVTRAEMAKMAILTFQLIENE